MKRIFSILIPICIFFLVGEIVVRSLQLLSKPPPYNTAKLDAQLGWKAKSNYVFNGNMYDAAGTIYEVNLTTKSNGFQNIIGMNAVMH